MPMRSPTRQDRADRADRADEEYDLDRLIGYNLKRATILVQADFRAAMGGEGLSPRVFSGLSFVVQLPRITQSELARLLGVERSGLVAIVDELERRDYVVRTHVPGDRRAQALIPTKTGEAAYRRALGTVRKHEDRFFADFSPRERRMLLTLLRKLRISQMEG